MKEKMKAAKEFYEKNKEFIWLGTFGVACYGFGVVMGQWSVQALETRHISAGAICMYEYIKANGLDAAENAIKTAYKMTK